MQDGAIVHLTEDGMQKCEVLDDHMIMHAHTSNISKREDVFFHVTNYFGISGALLFIGA